MRENLSMVVVDKVKLNISLVNKLGDTINQFPVAVGTNKGDKEKVGDLKTPEGTFLVASVENANKWTYDFEDDNLGPVDGAYGPWFIRLNVKKHKGIGIHGTHDNTTIGKRVSHGCIRMKNEDLSYLVDKIKPGIPVIITEDDVVYEPPIKQTEKPTPLNKGKGQAK